VGGGWDLVANKSGPTRLGFVLMLKFFELSSEVAAMIEGLRRHCTDAEIESNYVDTHGASVVGFAFTELLNFRLLPRLKDIGSIRIRLYRLDDTTPGCPALGASRPIRWELMAQQYDQMVKYATALRLGTAEAEQVLRRFTRGGPKHPTYAAPEGLGRPYAPSSRATTSPAPTCAARSTVASRSWRTGTARTPCSTTARTAPSPARTRSTPNLDARPAPALIRAGARRYAAASADPGRTGLGEEAVRRGPARTDCAVLVEHQPLRHLPTRHAQTCSTSLRRSPCHAPQTVLCLPRRGA
jgi:hypothetical protein